MNCPSCQTPNPAQARFCLGCGHLLVHGLVCSACHTLLPPHSRYCFQCGGYVAQSIATCTHCAAPLAVGQPHCTQCGNAVVVAAPIARMQPQQVSPVVPVPQAPPTTPTVCAPAVAPTATQAVQPANQTGVTVPSVEAEEVDDSASPFETLPQPRPLQEMLPSLRLYLPNALYEPLERRPTDKHIQETRDHLSSLLRITKTYLPLPVVLSPQPAGQAAGGLQRGVFLFGDVAGFTPLSEKLKKLGQAGAERIAEIVNELFFDLVTILFDHGGSLLQFGGDALIGVFPAQNDEEMAAGALRAVQGAMAMQALMEKYAEVEAAGDVQPLKIKCGISSGPYFGAHIGTTPDLEKGRRGTMAYVTTGHTVNKAEQAEGHASPGDTIITEETLALLGDVVESDPCEEGFRKVLNVAALEQPVDRLVPDEPPKGEVDAQITYLVERMDRLAPYLPDELIARIVSNPNDVAMSPDHRPVSIIFVNYVGISDVIDDLGESHPQIVTEQLNNYFCHMAEVVERYEGTIARMDQYAVGDRLVVFFGAPRAHEDDPVRAVYTALEMQQAVREHFSALQTPGGVYRFRQRIGINTGHVFAGNAGAPNLRQEYTLMGDDINMSARLMSNADWKEILITKRTKDRVENFIDVKDRGELKVKGKEILIPTFEALGRRSEVMGAQGPGGGERIFIGREQDLESLQQCMQGLLGGRGQIVSLIGDGGLGKSRLGGVAFEWLAGQEGADQIRILEAQALSFSEQVSYWLAAQILRASLGLKQDATEDDVLFTLWELGEELLGKENAREAIPFLAHLLNLELEGEWANWVSELDPKVRRKQTFWAAREFFAAFAARQPTIVIIEDMHFADEGSLALLEELFETTTQSPIMFCMLFRPQRDKGSWRLRQHAANTFPHRFTEVSLDALGVEDSRHLLDSLLPGAVFPQATYDEIFNKTAGNPFYLEEVVRSLIEAGAVQTDPDNEGQWLVSDDMEAITVPDSLQGAIVARIDRLTEDARLALQMASVIGRRFQTEVLNNLTEADSVLGTLLAQLERSNMIKPEAQSANPAYIFPDALVQEVAYDNLLLRRRQEFHRKVGQTLEEILGDESQIEAECELLAYHYGLSDDEEKAAAYLDMAGKKARGDYALQVALAHYQKLLALRRRQKDKAAEASVLYTLGSMAYEIGSYAQGETWLNESVALLRELEDPASEGWSVMYLGMIALKQGDYPVALGHHNHALSLSQAREDEFQEGIHLTNLARVSLRLGKYDEAVDQFSRSLEMKVRSKDAKGQGFAHFFIGLTQLNQGDAEAAEASIRKALELWEQEQDKRGIAYAYLGLGLHDLASENYESARTHLEQALEKFSELVLSAEIIESLSFLAQAQLALGDPETALDTSRRAMSQLQAQKDVEEVQQIYFNHYLVLSALDDPSAREFLDRAHSAMTEQADRIEEADEKSVFLDSVPINQKITKMQESEIIGKKPNLRAV